MMFKTAIATIAITTMLTVNAEGQPPAWTRDRPAPPIIFPQPTVTDLTGPLLSNNIPGIAEIIAVWKKGMNFCGSLPKNSQRMMECLGQLDNDRMVAIISHQSPRRACDTVGIIPDKQNDPTGEKFSRQCANYTGNLIINFVNLWSNPHLITPEERLGLNSQQGTDQHKIEDRGFIGVKWDTVTASDTLKLDMSDKEVADAGLDKHFGLLVDEVVVDGPAAKAGLQKNDLILVYNDETIERPEELTEYIRQFPNEKLDLTVWRNHQTIKLTVTIGQK
jgi:hypothetical protein